jgi:hypothetical protein
MNVTREVITDLLPLYFSDEASEDTRKLVDEFFRQDPPFAHLARRMSEVREKLAPAEAPPPGVIAEKESLKKTRDMLRTRNAWLWFAVAYTLAPLLFFQRHGQWWFMARDNPEMAHMFFFFGFFCWVAYMFYYMKLRKSGL